MLVLGVCGDVATCPGPGPGRTRVTVPSREDFFLFPQLEADTHRAPRTVHRAHGKWVFSFLTTRWPWDHINSARSGARVAQ
jgi:hypothetical protein